MQIYKDKYRVVWTDRKQNKDDNYIPFKQGQIYRYDKNILIIWIISKTDRMTMPQRVAQRIKDAGIYIVEEFMDDESIELRVNESDLDQVADVLKIRRKKKLDKGSEKYLKMVERISDARSKKKKG